MCPCVYECVFLVSCCLPACLAACLPAWRGLQGHAGEHGGKPGHLFVTIKVRAHPLFRWLDDDIHVNVPISLKQVS